MTINSMLGGGTLRPRLRYGDLENRISLGTAGAFLAKDKFKVNNPYSIAIDGDGNKSYYINRHFLVEARRQLSGEITPGTSTFSPDEQRFFDLYIDYLNSGYEAFTGGEIITTDGINHIDNSEGYNNWGILSDADINTASEGVIYPAMVAATARIEVDLLPNTFYKYTIYSEVLNSTDIVAIHSNGLFVQDIIATGAVGDEVVYTGIIATLSAPTSNILSGSTAAGAVMPTILSYSLELVTNIETTPGVTYDAVQAIIALDKWFADELYEVLHEPLNREFTDTHKWRKTSMRDGTEEGILWI